MRALADLPTGQSKIGPHGVVALFSPWNAALAEPLTIAFEALLAGNRVKQAIEAEYRGALGEAGFAALMQAFEILDGETD